MTCFLFGTIASFVLFILRRFTNVGIFEAEHTFKKSPIAILKIEPIEEFDVSTPNIADKKI